MKVNRNQTIPLLVLLVSYLTGFFFFPITRTTPAQISAPQKMINPQRLPQGSHTNLQLEELKFSAAQSVQPTPTQLACWYDDGICHPKSLNICCPDMQVNCSRGKCTYIDMPGTGDPREKKACSWQHVIGTYDIICQDICGLNDGFTCYGKPVILLYPERPTLVDVEVKTSGEIFVSDPLYPAGGWKNVLANPDGSLVYENKKYEELFYETKVNKLKMPTTGLVFTANEIEEKLSELLYQLGLDYSKNEIPEFMDFWLPKLKALKSKYIFVSLISKDVKEKNDLVIATPEPDTRIELIVYFKPFWEKINVEPLTIPQRPDRIGFTLVEWGGTIENN